MTELQNRVIKDQIEKLKDIDTYRVYRAVYEASKDIEGSSEIVDAANVELSKINNQVNDIKNWLSDAING